MGARGVHFGDARTVKVTARLQSGAVLPTVFPAPLDGIIAAQVRKDRLGDAYWQQPEPPPRHLVLRDPHGAYIPEVRAWRDRFRHWPLPLVKLRPKGVSTSQWVWAATCAVPDGDEIDVRWFHKRGFKQLAAEPRVDRIPANPDVGTFKAWRIPAPVTVCSTVTWWALGDPDGIQAVLSRVEAVGKHARQGEGAVLEWRVEDVGPGDWDVVRWLPDGRVARPFPPRYAAWLGVEQPELTVVDSFRPPYWRPPRISETKARTPREVIAPWTTRP